MTGSPSRWSDLERPPLRAGALRRALLREAVWRDLRVVERTGSTNADVAAAARAGAPEGLVVVAEAQTAGRGRLDRRWVAPPRSGLTFSVLLRPDGVPLERWGLLPLLTGVALVRAVIAVAGVEAWLKWPNDLLVGAERGKAAGVLVEVVGDTVVVGVGLNVTTRRDELPVATATSLRLAGAEVTDRDTLLRAVLRELASAYTRWRDEETSTPPPGGPDERHGATGRGTVLADYREMCDTLGRRVRVELPGSAGVTGTATDIDDAGRLILATSTGRHVVAVGDVVHLRADPPN